MDDEETGDGAGGGTMTMVTGSIPIAPLRRMAEGRLGALVKAVVDVGRPEPVPGRQKAVNLNAHDHAQLVAIGVTPEDFDEIIFFELNDGR